jgi:hypothetical protein
MNVLLEPGIAWRFHCYQCGSEFVIRLVARDGTDWRYVDCCPFCHNRDVHDKGAVKK